MGGDRPSGLQQYADNTTIHGIKDFVSTKSKVLKVIWGICLLAAGCLLCEEIYRTVKNYQTEPTSFAVKYVAMDSLPAIHVCVKNWFDDTKLRSLGFKDQDIAYLCWYFNSWDEKCTTLLLDSYPEVGKGNVVEAEAASRKKMKEHNLITLGEILDLTVPNIFPTFLEDTNKLTPWLNKRHIGRLCYSVSNVTFGYGFFEISISKPLPGVLVVGNNPFSMQEFEWDDSLASYDVNIWDVNKLTLLNKRRDSCNSDCKFEDICLDECLAVWAKCTCNLASPVAFPYMNEDFWSLKPQEFWFKDCNETTDIVTSNRCYQGLLTCQEKCKPCTIWSHQYRSSNSILAEDEGQLTQFHIAVEKTMKVSEEYFTYPTSSLVSNIGGLMGLFCGASLLSFIQAVVFWCEDGCRSAKVKVLHGQKGSENQV